MKKLYVFLLFGSILGAFNLHGMEWNDPTCRTPGNSDIYPTVSYFDNPRGLSSEEELTQNIDQEFRKHVSTKNPPSEEEIEEIVRNYLELEQNDKLPGFNVRNHWFNKYDILEKEVVDQISKNIEICVRFDKESHINIDRMSQILEALSNKITIVIFHKVDFAQITQQALRFGLNKLPNLKTVEFNRCKNLTLTNDFALSQITKLKITGSKTTNIINFNDLSGFKNLNKLHISKTAFSPKKLPVTLVSLRLVGKRINLSQFSNLKKKLPNLKSFRFYRKLKSYDKKNSFNLKTLPRNLKTLKLSFANLKNISKKKWYELEIKDIYLKNCKKINPVFRRKLLKQMKDEEVNQILWPESSNEIDE